MMCPSCRSGDVGEIAFDEVAEGIAFHYCRHCENRWWDSGSGDVTLTQVLAAATTLARR